MRKLVVQIAAFMTLLAATAAHADVSVEQGAMAQTVVSCAPYYMDILTVTATYHVLYDLAPNDSHLIQISIRDSDGVALAKEDFNLALPGFVISDKGVIDLTGFNGKGSFGFQLFVKGKSVCRDGVVSMDRISVVAEQTQ